MFLAESFFDLVFFFFLGQAWHGPAAVGSRRPELASPATFSLPEQMAFVCVPFHTLEDREGWRRVASRQAGWRGLARSHCEVGRCVRREEEGGSAGDPRGLRTGCMEQEAAAAAQA